MDFYPNIAKGDKIMYIKKVYDSVIKGLLDTFEPVVTHSSNWKRWVAHIGPHTCAYCLMRHGTVFQVHEKVKVPFHPHCKCELSTNMAIIAGNATNDGKNGADYWLKHYGKLPDYYVSREEYIKAGWKSGKPPIKWFPDKMMYGDIYYNEKGKLPNVLGRVWYEADINYYEGRRNAHRIYFSNDGLIFVSYDHGITFYEII